MILNQKNEIKRGQTFKLIIIGPPGVGKSSLVNRYMKNQYRNEYTPTIGVEFGSKLININDETIKLQIWDTAGQETFRSIVKSFYKNSAAVLLVYNISKYPISHINSHQTFEDLQYWHNEASNNCGPDCIFGLIGAQKDLQDERKVSIEQAQQFAKQKNLAFTLQISAKINQNIQKLFEETAKHIIYKKTGRGIQNSKPSHKEQQGKKEQTNHTNAQGQNVKLVQNTNQRGRNCWC